MHYFNAQCERQILKNQRSSYCPGHKISSLFWTRIWDNSTQRDPWRHRPRSMAPFVVSLSYGVPLLVCFSHHLSIDRVAASSYLLRWMFRTIIGASILISHLPHQVYYFHFLFSSKHASFVLFIVWWNALSHSICIVSLSRYRVLGSMQCHWWLLIHLPHHLSDDFTNLVSNIRTFDSNYLPKKLRLTGEPMIWNSMNNKYYTL